MRISEIMEHTGLTKKAIRYYEQEGLIQPYVNQTNQYREYSQDDLNQLIQIGVLRQLDFSILEIRRIINSPEEWREVLQKRYFQLSEDLQRIEQSKQIIESCLQNLNEGQRLTSVTQQLSLLQQSLELNAKEREGYMQNALTRIFPGYFGKMIVVHFGQFLNESLDTPEKEKAWLEMVSFFDEINEIEYPESFKQMLNQLSMDDLAIYEENHKKNIQKLITPSKQVIAEQKKLIDDFMQTLQENADFRSQYEESIKVKKYITNQLKQSGYYEKFVDNLKVLSDSYRSYHQTLLSLQNEVDISEIEKMYEEIELDVSEK